MADKMYNQMRAKIINIIRDHVQFVPDDYVGDDVEIIENEFAGDLADEILNLVYKLNAYKKPKR